MEEHFMSTLRVYEKKHPFPCLLINYDDGSYIVNDSDEDVDRDPYWLLKCLNMVLLGS